MKYKAFISYSHAADGKLAPAVQSSLHRFARPWYKLRAIHVFRDKTSLSATPALWGSIQSALKDSEYFLLLASPESAQSPWVEREVLWWLNNRSIDTILILLSDGKLVWDGQLNDFDWSQTTALGSYLKNRIEHQPLHVDLRNAKTEDTLSLRHSLFRAAILDISAPLQGKDKDQLDGEDVLQHRRTKIVSSMAIMTVVLFAAAASYQWRIASNERDTASEFLSQVHVTNGLNLIQNNKNYWGGLAWFAEALKWDKDNPIRERTHKIRIGAYLRHAPKLIQVIRHEQAVNFVEFSPDGRFITTATGKPYSSNQKPGKAYIWEVDSGEKILGPLKHEGAVISVSFSPDGSKLITGSDDTTARIWDIRTGSLVYPPLKNNGTVRRAYFIANGTRILTTGSNSQIWDANTGQAITKPMNVPDCAAWDADINSGEKLVVVAPVAPYSDGWGCEPMLWNIETGETIVAEQDGGQWSYSANFNTKGDRVVSAGSSGFAWIWDAKTGKTIGNIMHHDDRVSSAIYSPDGSCILTASWDGTARLWNAYNGKPLSKHGSERIKKNQVVLHHGGKLQNAVYSPDGMSIVTLGADGSARIWDATSGESLSPSLPYSVSAYRTETAGIIGTRPGDESYIAFSPEGRRIAVAGWDGIVRIWDLAGSELISQPFKPGTLRSIRLSSNYYSSSKVYGRKATYITPDGKNVIVDGRHWSVDTGLPLEPLNIAKSIANNKHTQPFTFSFNEKNNNLTVSADGRYELKSSEASARVWDIKNKQWITRHLQHSEEVLTGAFSSDGKWVATASKDGVTRVWEVKTSHPLTPHLRTSAAVSNLWFDSNSNRLFATSQDGIAWEWSLMPDKRDLKRLLRLTQYLSTSRLDNTGVLIDLEIKSFRDNWLKIKKEYPEDFHSELQHQIAWHQQMAGISENNDNWLGALLHLNWLIEHSPNNWTLFLRRARVYEALFNSDKAIKDYSRAIDLGSDDWMTWYGRGQVYLQLQKWAEAASDLAKSIEFAAPLEVSLRDTILLSAIIDNKELYDFLIKKLDNETDHNFASVLVTTWALRDGMSSDLNSGITKANEWYKKNLIELAPLYYRIGRYEEALKIQKKYFEKRTKADVSLHRVFLAMTQYQLGQIDEAYTNLEVVERWMQINDRKQKPQKYYEYKWRTILPLRVVLKEAKSILTKE